MEFRNAQPPILPLLRCRPQAFAEIKGNAAYPQIAGRVCFYQTQAGTIVYAQLEGLPSADVACQERIFGFHVHEGGSCSGNAQDPFADTLSHYNPDGCPHPYHAGDLPPLFGCNGLALALFLTDRFTVEELIGKTVVLHDRPDDFTTQPAGNAGVKIACGVIRKTK